MTDTHLEQKPEQLPLSERIAKDNDAAPYILEGVKALEDKLQLAIIRNTDLANEVEELQESDCFCDESAAPGFRLNEITRLMSAMLQSAQSRGPLDDLQREALHFLRTESLISW